MTAEDDRLDAVYRASLYVIHSGSTRMETRIDEPCAALTAVMRGCAARTAALMTACNPDSQPLPAERNLPRQRAFEDQLNERDFAFLPAIGQSPDGRWQEPGVLVLGIGDEEACAFARQWGQRAFVLYDETGTGRLRFVDEACR